MTKEQILKDDLKRLLVVWQVYKHCLETIRTSETITQWATEAKKNKNKNFVDFRVLAAEQLNQLNAMLFKMKKSMTPDTFNAIMGTLTSEQLKEIDLLLNEITELKENAIEAITYQVKEAKVRAGIPLNDPSEDITKIQQKFEDEKHSIQKEETIDPSSGKFTGTTVQGS